MRRPYGRSMQSSVGFVFLFSQTFSPNLFAATAKPKPDNCAQALILAAAKKNVKELYKNRSNGGGVCALGVRQTLQMSKVGDVDGPLGNAIDYVNSMPPHGFVDSGQRDPKKAPPGSVIVFSGPKTSEYFRTGKLGTPAGDWVGHVTIKGDDGYYYTDGRTEEAALGWSNDVNRSKTRNVAAIFIPGTELIADYNGKCLKLAFELEDFMSPQSLVVSAIVAASMPVVAASKVVANCETCVSTLKISTEVAKLNYGKKADRAKGRNSVEPALAELKKFLVLSEKDESRPSRFEALVLLVREVAPYDVEGQLTQSLAQKISTDSVLHSKFNSLIDSMRAGESPVDRCKTNALSAAVSESLCLKASGVQGQDHTRNDALSANHCIQAFNFESCLAGGN